jgi:murein L,D-transpeptidase YcbB/YkuD
MSEETQSVEEQEILMEEPQMDAEVANEEHQVEMSELDKAVQARMGHFEVAISPSDLKYVKNLLNNKIEWKGPNEAYLMLMALLNLSNELKELGDSSSTERKKIALPSTTLESINFFLARVTGKGEESAHRLFAVSMLLRPAMEEIKKLDEIIEKLQSEENSSK